MPDIPPSQIRTSAVKPSSVWPQIANLSQKTEFDSEIQPFIIQDKKLQNHIESVEILFPEKRTASREVETAKRGDIIGLLKEDMQNIISTMKTERYWPVCQRTNAKDYLLYDVDQCAHLQENYENREMLTMTSVLTRRKPWVIKPAAAQNRTGKTRISPIPSCESSK